MGWKEHGVSTTAKSISLCSTPPISRWPISRYGSAGSARRRGPVSHRNREMFRSATARLQTASGRTKRTCISSDLTVQAQKSEREYWRLALANGQEDHSKSIDQLTFCFTRSQP